uniref:ATP synthase B chain n=1 Tax=Gelidium gabrielsonii TaxID=2483892 RepID=A0A3G2QWT0_9FLOR|nr:ATP synthase B chain precursor [Gelidium gabrielsonii]AYO27593.1 ATP synthase B chain precursor [Gelidium gabrielsonii]
MLNITIFILTLLILISQNLLLLNEESLILLCFIIFTWLVYNKLKTSIQFDLNSRALNIHKSIQSSFDYILVSLKSELNIQQKVRDLTDNFCDLKSYFMKLNTFLILELKEFTLGNYQKSYKKKLVFTQRLEKQTSKLLALLIVKKLRKITNLNQYYLKNFQLGTWKCIYKITLREYFETIQKRV